MTINSPQGEFVPMATTRHVNEKTQELVRLLRVTKKTHPILSYNDLTDESVKSVLNTLARYEPNHENPPYLMNDTNYITTNQIDIYSSV